MALFSLVAVSTVVHSAGSLLDLSKHQSAYVLATRLRVRSLPRFSKSLRLTTSLISDSSLAMRSWATRLTTLVMRSCHSRSLSVISVWLRGRLTTAAAWVVPATATVRFWRKA